MKIRLALRALSGALVVASLPAFANGGAVVFLRDLPGFNAAAGNPPVAIDFDNIATGTDIGGQTIAGAKLLAEGFGQSPGAPLKVEKASDTFSNGPFYYIDQATNKLTATSGENVLSPGGKSLSPYDSTEQDDFLTVLLDNPVKAFGFDLLSQSADGNQATEVAVYDTSDKLLLSEQVTVSNIGNLGAGAPGGSDFWGVVSDSTNIKKIVIAENAFGASSPDVNIGFDTLRFGTVDQPPPPPPPPPTGIPLPPGVLTFPIAAAAAALAGRRLRR